MTHLEAASEFFLSPTCPVTLLHFDFSSCASACTKRMLAISTILQWKHDSTSHALIMKRRFDTYVQSWDELSRVVLPAPSSDEAFNRSDRLRMELIPSSTAMSEAIMDSLNGRVRDLTSLKVLHSQGPYTNHMDNCEGAHRACPPICSHHGQLECILDFCGNVNRQILQLSESEDSRERGVHRLHRSRLQDERQRCLLEQR